MGKRASIAWFGLASSVMLFVDCGTEDLNLGDSDADAGGRGGAAGSPDASSDASSDASLPPPWEPGAGPVPMCRATDPGCTCGWGVPERLAANDGYAPGLPAVVA